MGLIGTQGTIVPGQVGEAGPIPQVLDTPRHPCTRLLRSSVPGDGRNGIEADRRPK